MVFKLIYGNHDNHGVMIYDTLQLLLHSLRESGHDVHLEKNMCPGFTNIIIENFSYDFLHHYFEFAKIPNTKFIIIATEFFTGNCFNQFHLQNSNNFLTINEDKGTPYQNTPYWEKRYNTFIETTKFATQVWHLNNDQVNYFQKVVGCPVKYLPHGYVDGLNTSTTFESFQRDIDILFTGSLTQHRSKILSKFNNLGLKVKFLMADTPHHIRQSWVQRSKVALNLKQYPNWEYPSNSRIYYHLMNGPMVITESCPKICDLSNYILELEEDNFIESVESLIFSQEIKKYFNQQRERFIDEKPNQYFIQELIE
jgi:hypothetical protein